MRRALGILAIGLVAGAGDAAAQSLDGRWIAEERCGGLATGRNYVLTVEGRGMTARLAGADLSRFGSILAATVLLPNDSFLIDIPVSGEDSKVSYSGRLNSVGRSGAEGGLFSGARHTSCQLTIARMAVPQPGVAAGGGSGKPTATAGRPEPIPRSQAPATQGTDGVWRRPDGAVPDISAAPPASRRPADPSVGKIDQPAPARPASSSPPAASGTETELRRQLEEERRRRAMAESALRLQEELRRQGAAAPTQ